MRVATALGLIGMLAIATALLSGPARAAPPTLSDVYDAALGGDMARALALLDSVDVSRQSPEDSTARACLQRRFKNPPALEDLAPQSRRILNAYRLYWQSAMLRRANAAEAERALLDSLRAVLAIPVQDTARAATLDDASERVKTAIQNEGLFALTGVTSPYYELMIWRTRRPQTYRVNLPDRALQVHVVFLDGFVSLGWAGYATCDRYHSGGWATKDSLYALASAYDTTSEEFRVSYLAHEGRHFSDYGRFPKLEQPELEYRAKLTELAVSKETTYGLITEFAGRNGRDRSVPHHVANYWVARDLGRVLFGTEDVVSDPTKWRSIAADRIRDAARRLLWDNEKKLQRMGAATTARFLPE